MAENALASVTQCLDCAVASKEPVLVFCSTGQARTGMVLAFWLHRTYALPIAAAVKHQSPNTHRYIFLCQYCLIFLILCCHSARSQGKRIDLPSPLVKHQSTPRLITRAQVTEVIEHAAAGGATRKPSVEQVMQFAIGPSARGMLPAMKATAGGGGISFGTPRVDDRLHITFLQAGGTIDKDYPRLVGGYAFEIGDPAVTRLLRDASPAAFTHDVLSVCRKDSQEMTVEDRQALVEAIRRVGSAKFIVTHGTDTMIETAQYVASAKGIVNKTVVFTGAMRPAKMVDSDASFNLGCAVGALGVLGAGVYLAMNGRVYEAGSVRRDGRTGLFVAV